MLRIRGFRRASLIPICLLVAGGILAQDASSPLALPTGPTLAFYSETNLYTAKPEDLDAPFSIGVTNVWTNAIVIESVNPSCHCTVATLPSEPWVLQPHEGGVVKASVELDDREGEITKMLTFFTSVGERDVTLIVTVPPAPSGPVALTDAQRQAAAKKAAADSKAIFKGDCATCHVDKSRGLLGEELYAAACGICHDSPHRASMVPDLHALKHPVDLDFWRQIIIYGKTNTLMPGFARSQGGPLSDMQVDTLTAWLDGSMTNPPAKK